MTTTRRIQDAEVQQLAALAATIRADYDADDLAWEGSPFAWIRSRPSRQRGTIGEKLVAGWCAAKGLDVVRAPDSECDRLIDGVRTEIKFSTLWANGRYCFQQFRNQRYDIAICLGVSPFDAHCWVLPKSVVSTHLIGAGGVRRPQHGGEEGRDTAWVHVDPAAPHSWLSGCGGRLRDAIAVLRRTARAAK